MDYFDTSVVAAYYCPEPNSPAAEKIILHSKSPAISDLTELELASALSRKIREKSIMREDGHKIIALFQSHVSQGLFQKTAVELEHFQIARTWIAQFTTTLRTLDALHLAIAHTQNALFFTSDLQLAKAARHFGISVKLVGNSLKP
ncbi:MAG: type II toxin-antitoxin system VapC family toxin [Deltaproteobacteria bacterium]|nr:type II toxin-antitoxin system VapC family toxin [Deltaproteobacteria bacterium]